MNAFGLLAWFNEAVINRGSKTDGSEEFLGGFFHADEVFSAEELLELGAAEIGDGENLVDLEAGVFENIFDIFWMIIIKTIGIEILEVGGFETEGVDVGFFEPIAEHFREGFLVSYFDNGNSTGF